MIADAREIISMRTLRRERRSGLDAYFCSVSRRGAWISISRLPWAIRCCLKTSILASCLHFGYTTHGNGMHKTWEALPQACLKATLVFPWFTGVDNIWGIFLVNPDYKCSHTTSADKKKKKHNTNCHNQTGLPMIKMICGLFKQVWPVFEIIKWVFNSRSDCQECHLKAFNNTYSNCCQHIWQAFWKSAFVCLMKVSDDAQCCFGTHLQDFHIF